MKENSKLSQNIYFENLNSIRFIAASLVIVHHIEQFKSFFGIENNFKDVRVEMIGKLGVVLFFVLSGFLISYLLFKEKEYTKTISIRKFYIRRILRIWPLYFLIIILSFFVFPFIEIFKIEGFDRAVIWSDLGVKLFLYFTFLPNLVIVLYGMIPFVSVAWSIGVEEQFYLVWPVLNKKINNKWILMFSVIIVYFLIKRYIFYLPSNIHEIAKSFWTACPIDCMAIGGIFALLLYDNSKIVTLIRTIIYKKVIQWSILFLTLILILIGFKLKGLYYESYAILFGILILNFASNPNRIFSMENKALNFLGKISYGLYMYHAILIVFTIRICKMFNCLNNYTLYTMSFLLTIGLASFSYRYFEKRFIKKKVEFSTILSGDNAINLKQNND
jgi:peptidoglycan/LPS O-acetylase OafA/YrhL